MRMNVKTIARFLPPAFLTRSNEIAARVLGHNIRDV